jgi:hypothetical protein
MLYSSSFFFVGPLDYDYYFNNIHFQFIFFHSVHPQMLFNVFMWSREEIFYHGRDLLLPKCYDASADTFDFVGIFSVLVKII